MLTMKPATRSALEHCSKQLANEFRAVPRHVVVGEVESVTNGLLANARFDDYIPVLVHRHARHRLREWNGVTQMPDAA